MCALADTKLYCWGSSGSGIVLDPKLVSQSGLPGGVTLRSIATGYRGFCALGSDVWAYCWQPSTASNGQTNFYNGSYGSPYRVPQGSIPSGVTMKAIAGGGMDFEWCAIGSDNHIYCWSGENTDGTPFEWGTSGLPTTIVPQGAIPNGVAPEAIAASNGDRFCIVGSDGHAYCWQAPTHEDASVTPATPPAAVPQGAVPSGVTFRSIAIGSLDSNLYSPDPYADFGCALGSDGWVYCWGDNSIGQLGNGTTTNSSSPVAISHGAIPAGVTLINLVTGNSHACAVGSNSKIYCWGNNWNGTLGNGAANGTYPQSNAPVLVSGHQVWNTMDESSGSVGIGLFRLY